MFFEDIIRMGYAYDFTIRQHFPCLDFDERALHTLCLCAGFIVGVNKMGNIELSHQMAYNLYLEFYYRSHPNYINRKVFIHTDSSYLSFTFIDCVKIEKEETSNHMLGRIKEVKRTFHTEYYAMGMNGGIIFHHASKMHKLEPTAFYDSRREWWSTHT